MPLPSQRARDRSDRSRSSRERRINDVAVRLFTRNGFQATSMKDLAEALRMTPANLYNYYPSKQALLFAVVHTEMNEVIAREEEIVSTTPDPAARVHALAYDLVISDLEDPVAAFVSARGLDDLTPANRRQVTAMMRRVRENFQDAVREGVNTGVFDVPDVALATVTIVTACSFVSTWYHRKGPKTSEEIADFTARACLSCLGYPDPWDGDVGAGS